MQGNKMYIIFIVLVSITLGCSSTYKFKPQKDEYQYFFGIKLPVLSDNKKQFIVTDKMKKALKNVKGYNEVDFNDPSIRKKYLLGSENKFYDYRKNYNLQYRFDNNVTYLQKSFFDSISYLKGLNGKLYYKINASCSYYPNKNILNYENSIISEITLGGLNYGKEYVFSEKGEILFEIDYEKNFSMKLTKVFELASTYLPNCNDNTKIDLIRKFDKNNGYWVISQYEPAIRILDSTAYDCKVVIIDDKAKKIIAKKEYKPQISEVFLMALGSATVSRPRRC